MDMAIRKKFDPSVVFTEIMSSIKGSQEVLSFPRGLLTLKAYLEMADRRGSSFSVDQRSEIFKLFQQYEKRKRMIGDHDVADVVGHVYCELTREGYRGVKNQFVYIDEVQDLTQAQLALFKFVCRNLEGGFVFAGDTAQTIARGVGFRFEDIRRLFYNEFLQREETEGSDGKRKGAAVPDVHQLSINFRMHNGIVRMADSVIRLLLHFFPAAIDKLQVLTSPGLTPPYTICCPC
jgi:superfamily I DNA/RNA helicase